LLPSPGFCFAGVVVNAIGRSLRDFGGSLVHRSPVWSALA
jgi:hypothetical protein